MSIFKNLKILKGGNEITAFQKLKKDTNGQQISLADFAIRLGLLDKLTRGKARGVWELHLAYLYWLAGEKIYEIHPLLAQRFSATHLRSNIPTELLKLPFDCILIKLPEGCLSFTNNENIIVSVDEIVVSYIIEDLTPCIIAVVNSEQTRDVITFKIRLIKDNIFDCVEEAIKLWTSLKNDMLGVPDKSYNKACLSAIEGDIENDDTRNVFEFLTKCLLYITGANSDVEWLAQGEEATLKRIANCPDNKRKRIMQSHLDGAVRTYKVGYKIILSREEKIMYDNIKKGLWTLSYRFIVQGHFTHQVCGIKHSERKVIFIQPYWKGPEYADIVNAPHLVK